MNWGSHEILYPDDALAFRDFGIHKDDWANMMETCIRSCKFKTFPDEIANKKLPAEVLNTLPYNQDGTDLWNAIRKYVSDYLSVFYKDSESVSSDPEIQEFWRYYAGGRDNDWIDYGLPALTKESLIDLATHNIFYVTGGHELLGGLMQYIMQPNALGPRIMKDRNGGDIDGFFLSLSLIGLTCKCITVYICVYV